MYLAILCNRKITEIFTDFFWISLVSPDDILDFMAKFTEGRKPQTKRIRFSHLTAFFNFMRNNFDCDFKNPCDSQMLRKLFRPKAVVHWDIISGNGVGPQQLTDISIIRLKADLKFSP